MSFWQLQDEVRAERDQLLRDLKNRDAALAQRDAEHDTLTAERDQLRADLREACEIGLCIAEVPEERKRLAELREKAK